MGKIILIGGKLATGKTTLGKSLSEKLKIPLVYKDKIKEILSDSIGENNREENKKLSVAVFNIFLFLCKQFVDSNSDLILESNFKQTEIDDLKTVFKNTNYEVISIVLTGEDDILYDRYLNRFKNEHRHRTHSNFNSKEEFINYNNNLEAVNYFGKIIKLDANEFVNPEEVIRLIRV